VGDGVSKNAIEKLYDARERIEKLESTIREYIAEYDAPVPDPSMKLVLRGRLRSLIS
jgi:hypothetical protein